MQIKKLYRFEAAHLLPRHQGKCSNLHGHSWRLEVEVKGDVDPSTCFILDFYELDKWVQPIVDRFDHKFLNCFVLYPSSENIAIHIAHWLRASIPAHWNNIIEDFTVRLSETEKSWAEFNLSRDGWVFDLQHPDNTQWQSPEKTEGGADVAVVLQNVKAMLPELQRKYFDALTVLEQMQLYVDTTKEVNLEELRVK